MVTWDDLSLGGAARRRRQRLCREGAGVRGRRAQVGSEILVNTATENEQLSPADHGAVERRLRGDMGGHSQGIGGATGDSSDTAVKAQVFAADGSQMGSELLVNTATAGDQSDPRITALANGGFVVTWTDDSHSPFEFGTGIKAQVSGAIRRGGHRNSRSGHH